MAAPIGDGYESTGSCGEFSTLTTNSTTTLTPFTRAIYVATNGDLVVTLAWTSVSCTFSSVVGGSWLPIRAQKVHSCPAGTLALW